MSRGKAVLSIIVLFTAFTALVPRAKAGWLDSSSKVKGLVKITSVYHDEVTNKDEPLTGSGFTVLASSARGGSAVVVVTASHVSQGQRLRIEDESGAELRVARRIADKENDIEVLELENYKGRPFAIYDGPKRALVVDHSQLPESINPYHVRDEISSDHVRVAHEDKQFVVIPWWLNDKPVPFSMVRSTLVWDFRPIPYYDIALELGTTLFGDNYVSNARLLPGFSGTPLVRPVLARDGGQTSATYYVNGVATKISRFFLKSYFAKGDQVVSLIEKIQFSRLPEPNAIKWRMASRQTFREFEDGSFEMIPSTESIGKKGYGDGGGATGAYQISQDWVRYGLEAPIGMMVPLNGVRKPILAYEIRKVVPSGSKRKGEPQLVADGPSFVFEADRTSQRLISRVGKDIEVKPIYWPTLSTDAPIDFIDLLRKRFSHPDQRSQNIDYWVCGDRLNYNVPFHVIDATKGSIEISLKFGQDLVKLILDRYGRRNGERFFNGIYEIKGEATGNLYYIDIRRLFFTDLNDFLQKDYGLNVFELTAAKKARLFGPAIYVRAKKNPHEAEIIFHQF